MTSSDPIRTALDRLGPAPSADDIMSEAFGLDLPFEALGAHYGIVRDISGRLADARPGALIRVPEHPAARLGLARFLAGLPASETDGEPSGEAILHPDRSGAPRGSLEQPHDDTTG